MLKKKNGMTTTELIADCTVKFNRLKKAFDDNIDAEIYKSYFNDYIAAKMLQDMVADDYDINEFNKLKTLENNTKFRELDKLHLKFFISIALASAAVSMITLLICKMFGS